SLGAGRARDMWLRAGTVHLEYGAQISGTTWVGGGNAGSIVVEAPRITLTGGASIASSTLGSGQSGVIRITATDTLTLAGTTPDGHHLGGGVAVARETGAGAGNAGSIVVEAPRITLTGGAQIDSFTLGSGQGGTVRAMATDTLTFVGTRPDGAPSGMNADA